MKRRRKVIARLVGGIGNQLFIYAAARRLALANNAELVLDDISGFAHDAVYKRRYQLDHFQIPCRKAEPHERLSGLRRRQLRAVNRWRTFEHLSYIAQERLDFDSRLLGVKPRRILYLEGYWQSESYFEDVEDVIRSDLRIIPPTDDINRAMAERIRRKPAIAVHVRFFEPASSHLAANAPAAYYSRAVAMMEERTPGAHYFIFSDVPEAARDRIALPDERVTLVTHNSGDSYAFADLWLMSQCKHFIIANSTFSWWGAWLSDSGDRQVIAPGFNGITAWGFAGQLPERWIKL